MSTGEVTFSSIDQQQPSSELEDLGDKRPESEAAATTTAAAGDDGASANVGSKARGDYITGCISWPR